MKKNSIKLIKDFKFRYPNLIDNISQIERAINLMRETINNGGKFLFCGNGGSSSDADHIVGELMKGFKLKRRIPSELAKRIENLYPKDFQYFFSNLQLGFNSLSLSNNPALITAFSNDNHPDLIYAQQVLNYGEKKDILFAISTSGNSKNIIHASKIAKLLGLRIIGLTGKNGGQLKKFTDVLINVNETETYKVQELHLPIYHLICLILENEFYGEE